MFDLQPIEKPVQIQGFNSIYYFEFTKNFSHPPEKHNFWEMVYVDNGKAIAITDGTSVELPQGHVIFHEPNEIHAHISDKNKPNNMLVISFTANSPLMQFFKKKIFRLDSTEKTLLSLFIKEAKVALGKIPNQFTDKSNLDFSKAPLGAPQLLDCYLTEFLIRLARSTNFSQQPEILEESAARGASVNALATLAIYHMQQNIYKPLSLEELCACCICGKSNLNKVFKQATGQSPMNYYTNLKMNEAKKLLRQDNLSVSEISDMLGYTTIHNFSRAFKKCTGFSPIGYLKSIL